MNVKRWFLGLIGGIAIGFLVGAYFAYIDWSLNPGGIFQDEQGTNWKFVMETLTSWWVPVAGWVTLISWVVLFLITRFRPH
jgi:hypothetical protein